MKTFLTFFIFLFVVQQGFCQWSSDPQMNSVISNTMGNEIDPLCITDGANGSIIVFQDNSTYNIYAQRISSAGEILWGNTALPVVICTEAGQKMNYKAVTDGEGGAYIVWEDYRNESELGDIYIQHIDSRGQSEWLANGINVSNSGSIDDTGPFVCSDGSGGVIVGWNWDNYINNAQVAAQRYNSTGVAQWNANGVQVCTATGFRVGNSIVPDGASGAILFFMDSRDDPNGSNYNYLNNNDLANGNIYAQRLDGFGARLWGNNGVAVCTAAGNQYGYGGDQSTAVSDGSGGAIFVFNDERNGIPDANGNVFNVDIYAQKLNSNGVAQWVANGVAVTTQADYQSIESVAEDGAGGVVATFDNDVDYHVYSQRIISGGTTGWTVNGIRISSAAAEAVNPRVVADGLGNFIYCYIDYSSLNTNLFAQKVNGAGVLQWVANGVPVCSNSSGLTSLPSIVRSNNGATILSWGDYRNFQSTGGDIFASKLLANGTLASNLPSGYISTANGNWNDPATWLGGVVPPVTAEVTVKHNVTVTTNTTCASVTLEPPGNLVIAPGIRLTITQ
jgi:hypothetical protein